MFANDRLVGFSSALPFPHPIIKNTRRLHRTVIFPDYQGIGLGFILSKFVAEYYVDRGNRFVVTTSAPGLIQGLIKSKNWVLKSKGRKSVGSKRGLLHNKVTKMSSYNRLTTSWEYIKR